MLHLEIHQCPILVQKPDGIYYKEETFDSWEVSIVNEQSGEIKYLDKFDGFPLFSNLRTDKSNQYEKALACAINWCEFLGIDISKIRKFERKQSNHYKEFLKRSEEAKELKREQLKAELARLS